MVSVEQIMKDLWEVCFCPYCGEVMGCHSHFCENCNESVVESIDGGIWIKYFKDKYKLKGSG